MAVLGKAKVGGGDLPVTCHLRTSTACDVLCYFSPMFMFSLQALSLSPAVLLLSLSSSSLPRTNATEHCEKIRPVIQISVTRYKKTTEFHHGKESVLLV